MLHPFNVATDLLMCEQGFDRVVITPQILLAGDKTVDRAVALVAQRDGFLHLCPRVSLLEPFVVVAASWDQMVFGRPPFRDPLAQLTRFRQF